MDNNTAAKWLDDLAIYFERRDTHGEDKAFWANVYNAESVRKIKAAISASEARIERLEAALRDWTAALDELRKFEERNPNDVAKEWDTLFQNSCAAEDRARGALEGETK